MIERHGACFIVSYVSMALRVSLAAQEAGLTCVCLSHTVSERFILRKVARQVKELAGNLNVRVSAKDADPFTWKNV